MRFTVQAGAIAGQGKQTKLYKNVSIKQWLFHSAGKELGKALGNVYAWFQ
jgi:hypothetical protein